MAERHAEIAGAGIAGLTVAAALGQRGWTVTVHERDPDIRAFGAGIFIYENGLRVLEAIGAYGDATAGSVFVDRRETRDRDSRIVNVAPVNRQPDNRVVTVVRQQLLNALREAAMRAGAEIRTGSAASAAEADGTLVLASGERRRADLVIAADGVHSRVRDSLGLLRTRRRLADGGIRVLVPRLAEDHGPDSAVCREHWLGERRLVSVPCNDRDIYLGLAARAGDSEAVAVPVRKRVWQASFPHLASLIERIEEPARFDRFELIKLARWSQGRVSVIGDAAHAQPPNLGQGGGCSMMCALGLAVALDEADDLPSALHAWERRERPIVEHTQRVSMLYGALTPWPPYLRAATLDLLHRWPWLARQRFKTARYIPTGTAPV